MPGWTVKEIATLAKLSHRRTRYVLANGLVPGLDTQPNNKARRFGQFEAFAIGVATRLLDAGITSRAVLDCMRQLGGASETGVLYDLFTRWTRASVALDIGRDVALTISFKNLHVFRE